MQYRLVLGLISQFLILIATNYLIKNQLSFDRLELVISLELFIALHCHKLFYNIGYLFVLFSITITEFVGE